MNTLLPDDASSTRFYWKVKFTGFICNLSITSFLLGLSPVPRSLGDILGVRNGIEWRVPKKDFQSRTCGPRRNAPLRGDSNRKGSKLNHLSASAPFLPSEETSVQTLLRMIATWVDASLNTYERCNQERTTGNSDSGYSEKLKSPRSQSRFHHFYVFDNVVASWTIRAIGE